MCSNDTIVAHIQTFINMLETRHPDMHIISLEITQRESDADKELCRHCSILLQWMYMSMSLVISILWKEIYPWVWVWFSCHLGRECIYIYIHISLQVLPVFGEVCETVRQQKDSLLGDKTGLPNAACLERVTLPTLSMTW